MQKFSNMSLSEVASAAAPAARRVAVPTAKPASLSAEALNIPRSRMPERGIFRASASETYSTV